MEVRGAFTAAEIKERLPVKAEAPNLRTVHQRLERAFRQFPVPELAREDGKAHRKVRCPTPGEYFAFDIPSRDGGVVPVTTGENDSLLDHVDAATVVEVHDDGREMWEKGERAVVGVAHGRVGDDSRPVDDGRQERHLLEAFRRVVALGAALCQVPVPNADQFLAALHGIFHFGPALPVVDVVVANDPVVGFGSVHLQRLGDVGVSTDVEVVDMVLDVGMQTRIAFRDLRRLVRRLVVEDRQGAVPHRRIRREQHFERLFELRCPIEGNQHNVEKLFCGHRMKGFLN